MGVYTHPVTDASRISPDTHPVTDASRTDDKVVTDVVVHETRHVRLAVRVHHTSGQAAKRIEANYFAKSEFLSLSCHGLNV